nr:RNA-directed DNA polymerase, eukaryota [Tanacetum cinerariifolium]
MSSFPHTTGVVLEKGIPDHRPILLKEFHVDYGPTPFQFFHSWLEMEGFQNLVVDTWNNDGIVHANEKHQELLSSIDVKIDHGIASEEDFINRRDTLKSLGALDRLEVRDLAQKAKFKWALEGDENTKFFHSTLKTRRRQLAINGIMKNGVWIEEPCIVKAEFMGHFRHRFQQPTCIPPSLDTDLPSPLSSSQRVVLEKGIPDHRPILLKEFHVDYGPTPFQFFHSWLEMEGFQNLVVDTWNNDGIVHANAKFKWALEGDENTKFFHSTLKTRRRQLAINGIMKNGVWIEEPCIVKAEFMGHFGHRFQQPTGIPPSLDTDLPSPLSSSQRDFMERPFSRDEIKRAFRDCGGDRAPGPDGLHALTIKAEALGLFKGASIGRDNMSISHLMYADDVIFFGEWSWIKAHNLISMLSGYGGFYVTTRISGFVLLKVFMVLKGVLTSFLIEVSNAALGALFFPRLTVSNQKVLIYIPSVFARYAMVMILVFWDDIWCGQQPLKEVFPHIYSLDTDKCCSIANRVGPQDWNMVLRRTPRGGAELVQFNSLKDTIGNISLTNQRDSWQWSLDASAGFSVASVRHLVDSYIVDTDRRGIEVSSLLCPSCLGDLETVNHSFFNCGMAKDLWSLLAKWWELEISVCGNIAEWYDWLGGLHVPSKVHLFLEGVGGLLCGPSETFAIF